MTSASRQLECQVEENLGPNFIWSRSFQRNQSPGKKIFCIKVLNRTGPFLCIRKTFSASVIFYRMIYLLCNVCSVVGLMDWMSIRQQLSLWRRLLRPGHAWLHRWTLRWTDRKSISRKLPQKGQKFVSFWSKTWFFASSMRVWFTVKE